jgi:iron complex transport system substrate-binding protein
LGGAVCFALLVLLTGCRREPAVAPAAAEGPRVASLAPSVTEMVFAVGGGDRLVGRTTACNYPPEAAAVPVVGGFGEPSVERLLVARPTVVLDVALADETIGGRLEKAGLRRERVRCERLDDIPAALEVVGRCVGEDARAATLAAELRAGIAALRAGAAGATNRPTVYVEIWNDPLMTAGRDSFLSDLVALAGGQNLGDEADRDYFQVSSEWVVARNPDVVLCGYRSAEGQARDTVLRRSGWENVRAVRAGRVYDGFDNDILLRPGPRVLEAARALRDRLAPPSAPAAAPP